MTNTPTEREKADLMKVIGQFTVCTADDGVLCDGDCRCSRLADAILARPTPVKAEAVAWKVTWRGYDGSAKVLLSFSRDVDFPHAVAEPLYAAPQAPAPTPSNLQNLQTAPAPSDPVSGEGVKTYRVGDFIGRNPVLCIHGHIDPNNLCPLCEGYEPERDDPPTPTAKGGVVEAEKRTAPILAAQTTASTPGVTEITDEMVATMRRYLKFGDQESDTNIEMGLAEVFEILAAPAKGGE